MFSAGMWGAMWIVQVLALASIQGCVEPVNNITQPTPTASLTPAPTNSPIDVTAVTAAVRAFVNSPEFLNNIKDVMRAQIPDAYSSQSFSGNAATAMCLVNAPTNLSESCSCRGNYEVSANLQRCSGLKTIEFLKMNALDSSDFLQGAVIGAEVGMRYVECTGTAQAKINACSLSLSTSGGATLGFGVKKMSGQISAKVVAIGNQFCLTFTKVVGNDANAEDIEWKQQQLQLGALPGVQMPSALTQTLWTRFPTNNIINMLEAEAMKQLQDALQKQPHCF
jgi:hypothetical protein